MDPHALPQLLPVPGGDITLNDRRSGRSWQVGIGSFSMAVHPVTRGEHANVLGEPTALGGDRLPVVEVSWWDAIRYCNTLSEHADLTAAYRIDGDEVVWDTSSTGYRLPTEAEWEHACRAGTTGPRYGALDAIAWFRDNSAGRAHDVTTKQPNGWGLHDTIGNVWEWCWDLYDPEVYGSYRILRGGGWFDEQWSCRASVRRRSHPTYRIDDVGFRVARSGSSPGRSPVPHLTP